MPSATSVDEANFVAMFLICLGPETGKLDLLDGLLNPSQSDYLTRSILQEGRELALALAARTWADFAEFCREWLRRDPEALLAEFHPGPIPYLAEIQAATPTEGGKLRDQLVSEWCRMSGAAA